MRKARTFFFVCAGIFLLTLAYHIGARSAGAQSTPVVECVGADDDYGLAVINHHLWLAGETYLRDLGEIPSPTRAIACSQYNVVLEDGTVWTVHGGTGWHQAPSLPFNGATPAQRMTIGQLKERYATPTSGR